MSLGFSLSFYASQLSVHGSYFNEVIIVCVSWEGEAYELGGEPVQPVGSSFPCYESDGLVSLTTQREED